MYVARMQSASAALPPHKEEALALDGLVGAPLPEKTLCALLCELAESPGEHGAGFTSHRVPARSTIRHPMEKSDDIIAITEGWSSTSISIADGRRQILSYAVAGEIVPTSYLFAPLADRITVAITDVAYLKFNRAWVLKRLEDHPDIFRRFLRYWIDDKDHSEQLVFDLGRGTVVERVVRLLWDLKRRVGGEAAVDFPLRQRHIADSIGATTVKAGKVLKDLRRNGLIALDGRALSILNEAEVRRIIGR